MTAVTSLSRVTGARPAALIVAFYVLLMPFLAGLPRGSLVPLLRPSEALQLVATAGVVMLVIPLVLRGDAWQLRLRRTEWWLIAVTIAATALPLLWLSARAEPIGVAEILAVFPFVKFAALYVLARAAVCSNGDARAVLVATTAAGLAVAAVAVAQSLGVGPIIDLLTRFYANDDAIVIEAGRGSATIGSSIATGAYLTIGATIATSMGFASGRRRWFVVGGLLAIGALASGQVGTVLALSVGLVTVGWLHGRAKKLLVWGVPVIVVALVGLWPIVNARLASIDQGSGLPSSWVVRWINVTELYWPRLADGGWLLGVTPDATQVPPDVWRDIVYLEGGYLWLLWVGGVPLLVATVLFLVSAYRDLGTARARSRSTTVDGLAVAAQSAVVVFAVLSVLDPHLTLRASADLFFVLLAIGAASVPFAEQRPAAHRRWRELLDAAPPITGESRDARVQIGEAPDGWAMAGGTGSGVDGRLPASVETALWIGVTLDGEHTSSAVVALVRRGAELHGVVEAPRSGMDEPTSGLVWRAIVRCGSSLRLASLTLVEDQAPVVVSRRELKLAAALADDLEIERTHEVGRAHHQRPASSERARSPRPIRLEGNPKLPIWKRATDLLLATAAAVFIAPIAGICAVLVLRSGPGPVVFRQLRIGAGGLPFQMWKFRTMHVGNDDQRQRDQNRDELLGLAGGEKSSDDDRVTPIGRWLRRLSLDELPQLANVLRGEMSLVGPRPSLLWEVELFASPARRRLSVRPGVTGLWQTSGRGDVSMLEMLELDLDYVDSVSPAVDARCLAATVRSVVDGEGAA